MRKPDTCKGCPFYNSGVGFCPPSGDSRKIILQEKPTRAEVESGARFAGKEGITLSKIFAKGGMDKEDYCFTHLIHCHSPYITPQAIAHCGVHNMNLENAEFIVAMGEEPFHSLTGEKGVEEKRGYGYGNVVGTYSIEQVTRQMNLLPAVLYDIKLKAPSLPTPKTKMVAIEHPSPHEFEEFVKEAEGKEWLVVDIETPLSTSKREEDLDDDPSSSIHRISFAYDTRTAISIPYTGAYIDLTARILSGSQDKVFWNANFDVPRLEYNGARVAGKIVDAMWLWHFLQPDLPRGLGHAATYYVDLPEWKSKNISSPEYYSCCDAYATANIYVGVRDHLEKRGMGMVASRHITELLQVLRRMSQRGMCIDRGALDQFKSYLTEECEGFQRTMDNSVPDSIRRYHPKLGYVRTPKDTTGLVQRKFQVDGREVERWARLESFSANSSQQVKEYMKAMKHPIPWSKKKDGETTEKKFLERYAVKYNDPLYRAILSYRKTRKMLGTYTNWPIGSDGRVHTRFTLSPATGRLSSQNPNVQNIPQEGELAEKFRSCIVASPGNLLLRRDYAGIEAVLTGYFAGDPDYMRLAELGIHAYVLSHYMGKPVGIDDPDAGRLLKELKGDPANKKLYKKIKMCVHGINYGLGPDKMFAENPGVFESVGEARKLRRFVLNLFPKIAQWQEDTVDEARRTALIVNPYGYLRWFWDIPGEDGPKAIAQRPQSTASAIIKDAMLLVDADELIGEMLIWQIHDELVLDCPESNLEECDRRLMEYMESPIKCLGGLKIRTERKVGHSLK